VPACQRRRRPRLYVIWTHAPQPASAMRPTGGSVDLESVVFCSTSWSQQPAETTPPPPTSKDPVQPPSLKRGEYGPQPLPQDSRPVGPIAAGGDAKLEEDVAGPSSFFSLRRACPHSLHRPTDRNLGPPRRRSPPTAPWTETSSGWACGLRPLDSAHTAFYLSLV
jgi:hypothetical protein